MTRVMHCVSAAMADLAEWCGLLSANDVAKGRDAVLNALTEMVAKQSATIGKCMVETDVSTFMRTVVKSFNDAVLYHLGQGRVFKRVVLMLCVPWDHPLRDLLPVTIRATFHARKWRAQVKYRAKHIEMCVQAVL